MQENIIDSERQKTLVKSIIDQMNTDGSDMVITKKTPKDATYKQQKLWMMWCGEVANSGLGKYCVQSDVHIAAKWKFVIPLLIEEDEIFASIYNNFIKDYQYNENFSGLCKRFAKNWVHTNDLTREGRIKSLNEFEKYWGIEHGVNLTIPSMQGVDLTKF